MASRLPSRLLLSALAFAMLLVSSAIASAQDRLALIIGNAKYQSLPSLDNPSWDAEAVGSLLSTAGFDVTSALDLNQTDMRAKVREFTTKLTEKGPDSVALIYFAGHGVQIDGQNYLLPVDATIKSAADVPTEAIRLSDVMNLLAKVPSKTRIMILDACRNDPFEAIKNDTGRGLAIVNAPAGTLVAYSTSPGSVALDGETKHSPFVKALIKAAAEPGAGIATVFQNTRLSVHKATDGQQTPWEVTALTEPFKFFPGAEAKPFTRQTRTAWRNDLKSRSARDAYDVAIAQNNVIIYQIYLTLFPDSEFAGKIRIITDRRLEMHAWYDAITRNTIAAYEAFLARYPNSDLALTAQRLKLRSARDAALARTMPGALDIAAEGEPVEPKVVFKTREIVKKVFVPKVEYRPVYKDKIVYKDRIRYKTKVVYKDRIRYKTKVVYKDRIIHKKIRVPVIKYRTVYKNRIVYRNRVVFKRKPCRCRQRRQRHQQVLQ